MAVGIYSTAYQWGELTGGAALAVPSWLAGAADAAAALESCWGSFTGGPVVLVQYPLDGLDANLAC